VRSRAKEIKKPGGKASIDEQFFDPLSTAREDDKLLLARESSQRRRDFSTAVDPSGGSAKSLQRARFSFELCPAQSLSAEPAHWYARASPAASEGEGPGE